MRLSILLIAFSVIGSGLFAQKQALTHDVYDGWKTMKSFTLSNDGRFIAWEENPNRGDGFLIIYTNETGRHDTIVRGASPAMPASGAFVALRIKPEFEVIRQLKIKKKKESDFPKDTVAFWIAGVDSLWCMAPAKQLQVPARGSDIAVLLFDKEKAPTPKLDSLSVDSIATDSLTLDTSKKKDEVVSKRKFEGTRLAVIWPLTHDSICFANINDFSLSPSGSLLLMLSCWTDSLDSTRIVLYNTKTRSKLSDKIMAGKAMSPFTNEDGSAGGYLWTPDTGKTPTWRLMLADADNGQITQLTDTFTVGLPFGYAVSQNKTPWFSRDGRKLYFGMALRPEPEPKDSLPDDEKVNMDVWAWTDTRLQPQQLKELKGDENYAALYVYNMKGKTFVELGNDSIRNVRTLQFGNNRFSLGINELPYQREQSWSASGYADFYLIDSESGSCVLLKKMINDPVSLSPDGRWFIWFDRKDSAWHVLDAILRTERNLTANLPGVFWDDEDDTPAAAGPHGLVGWGLNGPYALINDKNNVWLIDASGKENAVNLTSSAAENSEIVFRYIKTDPDETLIDLRKSMLFKTFDRKSKDAGFTRIWLKGQRHENLISGPYVFDFVAKAKNTDVFLFRKSNYNMYPDLWVSESKFDNAKLLSNVNPQQSKYLWGDVKLVNYTGRDGIARQGLLYLPENINPNAKYPMIVYFYEKYSDELNNYYTPGPSRSVISFPYYNSNGYVVFIPDITYRTGYPGQSAFDCIMGGVDDILKQYPFIDSTRMGLQGQSWGGYQVAWMITRTNRFKAAMAGAAVTNMTSAYGGIRWESGVVRQFQYEQSQSRIGQTLWEAPELYIENSPLFAADKVSTPLLMMNNDNDGAVPWYQGIEFFTALRRLNQPVWLLVYNGDDHNLMKWPNRVDLSIRMLQFFDYYLKGQSMPPWMQNGIPAIEKGENAGY